MKYRIEVDNIKCGGCAQSIERALGALAQVRRVAVDVPTGAVTVDADADVRVPVRETLERIGFPERRAAGG